MPPGGVLREVPILGLHVAVHMVEGTNYARFALKSDDCLREAFLPFGVVCLREVCNFKRCPFAIGI